MAKWRKVGKDPRSNAQEFRKEQRGRKGPGRPGQGLPTPRKKPKKA